MPSGPSEEQAASPRDPRHREVRTIARRWLRGVLVGTAFVWLSSPLFVRSYAPLVADPLRRVWTLPPGQTYRWRSEGYANTRIGPHGMPGRTSLASPTENAVRVALWGDSQAEGVCLPDEQKLFAQSEAIAGGQMAVLPLTRSGEDASQWVTQIPLVEPSFAIDAHVLLIVELSDLAAATRAPVPPPSEFDVAAGNAAIASRLPAFVIQSARNLLTEPDGSTRRKLRFGIGPTPDAPASTSRPVPRLDWQAPLAALRRATDQRLLLVYAPKVPQIIEGQWIETDPTATSFAALKPAAESLGIQVIDARPALLESARRGIWPHGFQNGQIGAGHLNARGYALIASLLVDAVTAAGK